MAMDLDVRLLRSFVCIYERGSLSRAADQLACTQAAMSMRLKLLETELGEPLFHRHHHRLEPTFKGTAFYAKALTVLAAYDEMMSQARNQVPRPRIRIGVPDDYAIGLLPEALRAMPADGLAAEFEITCDLSANLAAALSRNEIDIALVTLAAPPRDALTTISLPLRWVHAAGYAPGASQPVSLVAYPEGCVFRRAMITALSTAGMPWAVMAQSRNRAGIVAALRGGVGVSAMARGTVPQGVVDVSETVWLPALPAVPVSVLAPTRGLLPAVARVAEAIVAELERLQRADASERLAG